MSVLVYGATGQVARALRLAAPDWTFLSRDQADLSNPDAIAGPILDLRPDLVVNAAAYTAVDKAETEPDLARRINATAPGVMAQAARQAGAGIVHLSTDYVFNGAKQGPWVESDAPDPINTYGATKLAGEIAVADSNPRSLILRVSWIYAPFGANFARTMLRLADRPRLTVVADQVGAPTSALDLADAIAAIAPRLIAAKGGAPLWGLRHYAGAGSTHWAGFAQAIFAGALSRGLIARAPEVAHIPTSDYPTPAARPANSVLDCAAFIRDFGIPLVPWRDALDRVLDRMEAIS